MASVSMANHLFLAPIPTPAQRAGLVVEGENKWLSLIKAALTTKGGTAS